MMTEEEKKESAKRARQKWNAKNRERIRAYERERYKNLPEEKKRDVAKKSALWAKANPEARRKSSKRAHQKVMNDPDKLAKLRIDSRVRYDNHIEERRQYQRDYHIKNRKRDSDRKRKWYTTGYGGAQAAVRKAIKNGDLVRPGMCPECGLSKYPIEAHHYKGYAKKHWLDIVWLCKSCHRIADQKIRNRSK